MLLGQFGVTSGVTLAADQLRGRANFGHAFLGQLIGSIAALPFVIIGLTYDALAASMLAAGVLPLAGAMLGYELGHGSHSGEGTAPQAFLVPTVGGALAALRAPL